MKIPLPPDLFSIEKWKAFKGKYPPNSDVGHRIIIVYKHEGILKYFYVTSQCDKVRKRAKYDKGSLVDKLNNSDWDALDRESCIQCDSHHLHDLDENELRKSCTEGKTKVLGEIPKSIKISIISAICASKTFSDIEKKMYTV